MGIDTSVCRLFDVLIGVFGGEQYEGKIIRTAREKQKQSVCYNFYVIKRTGTADKYTHTHNTYPQSIHAIDVNCSELFFLLVCKPKYIHYG